MGGRFAAISAVVAIVLLGCAGCGRGGGGGDPATPTNRPASTLSTPVTSAPTGPTTPPPPSVPADVPTTGPNLLKPGEQPPVMPIEATKHTPEGAVAFAKFFVQTIDWGFATTSGAYMRHYFQESCVECRSHANGLDNTRKAGQHYLGGRFSITDASTSTEQPNGNTEVVITFDITSVAVLNSAGNQVNFDRSALGTRRQFALTWIRSGWQVQDMRPTS